MRNRSDREGNGCVRRLLVYCRRILRFCYGYCCCYLLLTTCALPLSSASNVVNSGAKIPATKGNIVEGSGAFGGDAAKDSEWHSSGASPDDEPGDEDSEEGSGNMIEGSGIPIHADRSRITISTTSSTVFISSTASTKKQTENRFIPPSHTSSSIPPFLVSTAPVLTTISTTPNIVLRTTSATTTTKKPVVVVNTRPPLQIPQPEPPYIADAGESFEMLKPGILAAVSGGAVVGVLMTILLVMFIVYRMRKKDEGSYSLDEPHQPPNYSYAYQKASTKEFYA